MKITGLDAITRQLEEVEKAVAELDGDLAHVKFNAGDPQSIEHAITQLNAAIDEKIARYAHNEMVAAIADELKENGRNAILERATEARLEQDNGE